ITDGRNAVREYAISKGYDHVWFVDTDIRPPPSSLSKLLADRKDIVTGLYLDWVNIEGKNRVMPIVYDFTDENEYCRPMWLNDVVGKEGLMEIFFAGFGCTLATRKVIEAVSVRFYKKSMSGEDLAFYVDARKAGFGTYADAGVKCPHLVLPSGDPRNRKFRFETYEKGESYSFDVSLGES
ncbi:hypothetical protein KY363_07240, partial [Candidatus Woesearchaeota archaeon]|nr:hypothetical protein [Candidatus Woesearchaeota archaeon]